MVISQDVVGLKRGDMQRVAEYRRQCYGNPSLQLLFLELTQRCNEHCLHCGSRCEMGRSPEVPTDKHLEVLARVARRYDPHGIQLCVTGGEPLLRKGLFDLMAKATQMGFTWGMTTNGTLITPTVAQRLAESGMRTVSVSVDGLRESHEWFRQRKGSYNEAMSGLQNLLDVGVFENVQITTVVHKRNVCELDDMLKEFDAYDIDSWRLVSIEPMGRALDRPDLLLDPDELRHLLDFIARMRAMGIPVEYGCSHYLGETYERVVRNNYFLCNAGIHVASIMADGSIGSCLDIERCPDTIMGNVYEDDFVDVWEHGFDRMRVPLSERCAMCEGCDAADFCAGGSWHSFDFDACRQRVCLKGTLF